MPAENVIFTGRWTFTPRGSHNVTYIVIGNAPQNFTPAIPAPAVHQEGVTGIAVAPTLTSSDTTNGVQSGTWTFSGWTTIDVAVTDGTFTMPDNDVVFTGYWTFTADPIRIIRIYYYLLDDDELNRDMVNNPYGRQYYELIGNTFSTDHVLDRNVHYNNDNYVFEGWLVHLGGTYTPGYLSDKNILVPHGSFVVPAPSVSALSASINELNIEEFSKVTEGEIIGLVMVWSLDEDKDAPGGGSGNDQKLPQTGVDSNEVLWLALLLAAILSKIGVIALMRQNKRSRRANKTTS